MTLTFLVGKHELVWQNFFLALIFVDKYSFFFFLLLIIIWILQIYFRFVRLIVCHWRMSGIISINFVIHNFEIINMRIIQDFFLSQMRTTCNKFCESGWGCESTGHFPSITFWTFAIISQIF